MTSGPGAGIIGTDNEKGVAMFIRRLMKTALTVFCFIPLVYCHDFFVFGAHRLEFVLRFAHFLSEPVLLQASIQSLTVMVVALVLAGAVMWWGLRMHRWIDRIRG